MNGENRDKEMLNHVLSEPLDQKTFREVLHDNMEEEREREKNKDKKESYLEQIEKAYKEEGKLALENFDCVRKFKSVKRAIRRGRMTITGVIAPRRPFNNRKPTRGRAANELKKSIYGRLKGKGLL